MSPSEKKITGSVAQGSDTRPELYSDDRYVHDSSDPDVARFSRVTDLVQTGRKDRGVWKSTETYRKNDFVLHGKHKYVCIAKTSKKVVPGVTPNWRKTWTFLNVLEYEGISYTQRGIGFDAIGSLFQLKAHS